MLLQRTIPILNQFLQDSEKPYAATDAGNRIDVGAMHFHGLIQLDMSRLRDGSDLNEDAEEVRFDTPPVGPWSVIHLPPRFLIWYLVPPLGWVWK